MPIEIERSVLTDAIQHRTSEARRLHAKALATLDRAIGVDHNYFHPSVTLESRTATARKTLLWYHDGLSALLVRALGEDLSDALAAVEAAFGLGLNWSNYADGEAIGGLVLREPVNTEAAPLTLESVAAHVAELEVMLCELRSGCLQHLAVTVAHEGLLTKEQKE